MKQYNFSFLLSLLFFTSLSFCSGSEDRPLTVFHKEEAERHFLVRQLSLQHGPDFPDKKINTLIVALKHKEILKQIDAILLKRKLQSFPEPDMIFPYSLPNRRPGLCKNPVSIIKEMSQYPDLCVINRFDVGRDGKITSSPVYIHRTRYKMPGQGGNNVAECRGPEEKQVESANACGVEPAMFDVFDVD